MNDLEKYLKELKERKGYSTDMELAEFLGLRKQEMSRAKKRGYLTDEQCILVALEIETHPILVIMARESIKDKNQKFASVWKSGLELCKQNLPSNKDYRK